VRVDYAAISIEQRGFFAKPAGGGCLSARWSTRSPWDAERAAKEGIF
jgi:hypothetical protein